MLMLQNKLFNPFDTTVLRKFICEIEKKIKHELVNTLMDEIRNEKSSYKRTKRCNRCGYTASFKFCPLEHSPMWLPDFFRL